MNIVFMGTPDFAATVFDEILKSGHKVLGAVTQPDKAKDRGKKVQFTPVKELALANNIPVYQPEKVKNNPEFVEELRALNPDIIVVVAYGKIIPKEILDMPKYGCINVHASLLPRLRGAAPIQHAIIDGEEKTGVTIMQMAEGLDTGDMLTKVEVEIAKLNYSELHDVLAEKGAKLLIETLELIENGEVKPEVQDDSLSTYANMIFKQDGKIDFNKPAVEIERLIRGFDPWPGAFTDYTVDENTVVIKFWKADVLEKDYPEKEVGEIVQVDNNGIIVNTGKGALLVKEIQVPGKKRVSVADYLRGNKILTGVILK